MKKTYIIQGLDCPNCASGVERHLKTKTGITDAVIVFASGKLTVEYDGMEKDELYRLLTKSVREAETGVKLIDPEKAGIVDVKKAVFTWQNILKVVGAALFVSAVVLEFTVFTPPVAESGHAPNLWLLFFYLPAYLLSGFPVLYRCVRNIARGRIFDENLLMTVATVGAFFLGEYLESVSVMIFYQIGEFFNELAVTRSRNSVRALIRSKSESVTRRIDEHNTEVVEAGEVRVGDTILVKAGEQVALDSIVIRGNSSLDNSALTGESVPVEVGPGDEVLSGAVNLSSLLTASVARGYSDSMAAKIIDMVENAAAKKSKSEQFITKFSKIYTPVVMGIALVVAVLVPLIGGFDFLEWAERGLVVLLVACPCALVLSIPMCYFGGLGAASRKGILLKGSNYLDSMRNIRNMVFDKTGTLTHGSFSVSGLEPAPGVGEAELLYYAAYAESMSTHPIARSIVRLYPDAVHAGKISDYTEQGGYGVSAKVDGKPVCCGNRKLLRLNGVEAEEKPEAGTVIHVAADGKYLGCILLEDAVKPEAAAAIADMKSLGVARTIMLTGDKKAIADKVGAALKLDETYAELLPDGKMEKMAEITKTGHTAFLGEGINDALALSRADIGIAMGLKGSDVATEVADVIVMTDEVHKINTAIRIARRTRFLVYLDLVLILLIKIGVMALSVAGVMTNMLLAELADVGVAVLATLIAMTILRYNPEKRGQKEPAHTAK